MTLPDTYIRVQAAVEQQCNYEQLFLNDLKFVSFIAAVCDTGLCDFCHQTPSSNYGHSSKSNLCWSLYTVCLSCRSFIKIKNEWMSLKTRGTLSNTCSTFCLNSLLKRNKMRANWPVISWMVKACHIQKLGAANLPLNFCLVFIIYFIFLT